MMFRSLFFAAPLLVAGEVEEQSVLLQLKGRAGTQELLQRASAEMGEQTLRNLEENLIAKGGKKVETAKCAYHMKTPKAGGKTPCEVLDVLDEVYEESLDEFEDFDDMGSKAVKEIMTLVKKSLPNYPDENLTHTFVHTAEKLNVSETKFHKALIKGAEQKLGAGMNETDAYYSLMEHGLEDEVQSAFEHLTEVQDNVMALLKGEALTRLDLSHDLPVNSTFNISELAEASTKDATKMFDTYAKTKLKIFLNEVGGAVADFWVETLAYDGEDAFEGLDWSVKSDVNKAEKQFWVLASGYADGYNVEPKCTSEQFDPKKPILKKVCKGSSKPKCLDELMYLQDSDGTDGICEVVNKLPRKIRGQKFTATKFLDYCNTTASDAGEECEMYFRDTEQPWVYCTKPNDVRKGCKQIVKFNRAEAKRALKAKKKSFNAAKKACYKLCKKVDRADRKTCKTACKTNFHKDKLDSWGELPAPNATATTLPATLDST